MHYMPQFVVNLSNIQRMVNRQAGMKLYIVVT